MCDRRLGQFDLYSIYPVCWGWLSITGRLTRYSLFHFPPSSQVPECLEEKLHGKGDSWVSASLNVYRKCCDFVNLCSDWLPVGTFQQTTNMCRVWAVLTWAHARLHGHYLWVITEMCWWECEGNKLSVQPVSCHKLVFTDGGKRKCSDTEHGNDLVSYKYHVWYPVTCFPSVFKTCSC